MKEAGEGLVVGGAAAGGALVGGPVGATLAATATHLAFKAADGSKLQEQLNEVGVEARKIEYVHRTWGEFFTKFKWFCIAGFLAVLFFRPGWVISVPISIYQRLSSK